jgi:hypothetical protein
MDRPMAQASDDRAAANPRRRLRVVFGMTSATERPEAIEQLIDLLGGRPVVLHHDFTKQPGLRIDRPNVHFTAESHVTGWGTWALCQAVLSTIRHAVDHLEFDYFQLLSPSCLPLRPIDEFEASLEARPFDGSMDLMDIRSNADFLMNYGWRMYAPKGSVRQWILRKARSAYFGPDAERVQPFGLSVLADRRAARGLGADVYKRLAVAAVRTLSHPAISRAPFSRDFRAFVGSFWFGASRALCEDLLRGASDPRIVDYFSHLHIPDELLFATLAGNSGRRIAPAYHLINTFNERGSPRTFRASDLPSLLARDAWFARKFPASPDAPARVGLITARHAGSPAAAALPPQSVLARPPKVVFGICVYAGELPAVARLAERLDGRLLVVHVLGRDAGEPRPQAPNIDYAPPSLAGGFRPTGLNAGLLQLLRYCVECVEFDHLQLLPVNAQPQRPIEAFERFVGESSAEIHARVTSLRNEAAFGRHLSRVCASPRSGLAPLLRWAESHHGSSGGLRARAAGTVARIAGTLLPLRYRALRGLSLSIGSPTFGASRDACAYLVRYATDRHWVRYATAIDDDGAVLFGTLVNDGTFRMGPPIVEDVSDVREAGGVARVDAWFTLVEPRRSQDDAPVAPRAASGRLVVAESEPLAR